MTSNLTCGLASLLVTAALLLSARTLQLPPSLPSRSFLRSASARQSRRLMSSSASKRKSSAGTSDPNAATGEPAQKRRNVTADSQAAPAAAADQLDPPASSATRSDQQEFMRSAYSVRSPGSSAAASSSAASSAPLELSEAQRSFVNHGLERWKAVRRAWVRGEPVDVLSPSSASAGDANQVISSAAASAASAAASSSPAAAAAAAAVPGGRTPLPHPMSSLASHKPLARARGGDAWSDAEDPVTDDGNGDEDEFVAADLSSDEEDINQRVPAILAARDAGIPFQPRVKLSHMVDILIVMWEEEEEI